MNESFHSEYIDWSAGEQSVTIKNQYGREVEKIIPYSDIEKVTYYSPSSLGYGSITIESSSPYICEHLNFGPGDTKRARDVFGYIYRRVKRNSKQRGGMSRVKSRRITICMVIIAFVVAMIIVAVIPTGSSSSSDEWWRQYGYHSAEEAINDAGYYRGPDGKWYR